MAGTLKDIATEAGLSNVTISKALRRAESTSQETRERVFAIAEPLRLVKPLGNYQADLVGLIYSPEGPGRAWIDAQLIGVGHLADRQRSDPRHRARCGRTRLVIAESHVEPPDRRWGTLVAEFDDDDKRSRVTVRPRSAQPARLGERRSHD